jgi:hypothetical protein
MALFENIRGVAMKIHGNVDDAIKTFEEKAALLPQLTPAQLEALEQLVTPVWDGYLISKQARSELCDMRLASRYDGLNFLTQDGYCVLSVLGHLRDGDKFWGGKPWKTYVKKEPA